MYMKFTGNFSLIGVVTTITDQKATVGLPFSYRVNRKTSVLVTDPNHYSSVELSPSVTFTNNATYDSTTRLFQWKPNAVGDKSSVRVLNGYQTIDFGINKYKIMSFLL